MALQINQMIETIENKKKETETNELMEEHYIKKLKEMEVKA